MNPGFEAPGGENIVQRSGVVTCIPVAIEMDLDFGRCSQGALSARRIGGTKGHKGWIAAEFARVTIAADFLGAAMDALDIGDSDAVHGRILLASDMLDSPAASSPPGRSRADRAAEQAARHRCAGRVGEMSTDPVAATWRARQRAVKAADTRFPSCFPKAKRIMQIIVRDNNVDQALRVLKKKMQREGVYREMKLRKHYEKP